ncbi:hypothetical protein VTK73DRAFT_6721 [Phialemonium thermophilum]|uniref:Pentatricopeptide repeat-containing protein n=1 Tax=Phialemonium thermophilum TaxID=223376 RepID=A0ABR3XV73_9PEZI
MRATTLSPNRRQRQTWTPFVGCMSTAHGLRATSSELAYAATSASGFSTEPALKISNLKNVQDISRHETRLKAAREPASSFVERLSPAKISNTPALDQSALSPDKQPSVSVRLVRRLSSGGTKASLVRDPQLQQLVYLTRNCDPEQKSEVRSQYKAWRRRFSRLWEHFSSGKEGRKHSVRGEAELIQLLGHGTAENMCQAWQQKPAEIRRTIWPDIILAALRLRPAEAHIVLKSTFEEPVSPFYAVCDVVSYLVRRLSTLKHKDRLESNVNLADLVVFLLQNCSQRYLQFRQHTLFLLAKELEPDHLSRLYKELVKSEHLLHPNTLLQFASRLAKDVKHKPVALQILESLLQTKTLDINTPRGAALCTSILSLNKHDLGSHMPVTPAELFERLLDLGLRPNLITYSVIISNLCLNREIRTAWEVFNTMTDHGIEPDPHLYSILLNGAKFAEDFMSIRRIAQNAHSKNVRDPVFWNGIVHAVFVPFLTEARRRRIRPPRVFPAFRPMLKAYAKFFNLDPLRSLMISDIDQHLKEGLTITNQWDAESKVLPFVSDLPTLETGRTIEPTSDTLGIMMIGYVRSFSKAYNIIAFYSHFRSQLLKGDPTTVRFVREKGSLFYDIVIKAVSEWSGLLNVALEVVSDMLKGSELAGASDSSDELRGPSKSIPPHPAPSVYTWSILLNGFMHHRKFGEAERILRMMLEYGVQPTLVTWNTLLAGYAREQRVEKTVKTFQRIETAGYEPDDFTFRAFSYLRDKEMALKRVEAMVALRKSRLEKDGQQGRQQNSERRCDQSHGFGKAAEKDEILGQLQALENEVEMGCDETSEFYDEEVTARAEDSFPFTCP